MSVRTFEELMEHVDHDVNITAYGTSAHPLNIAVECDSCGEVLWDIDNPDELPASEDEKNAFRAIPVLDQLKKMIP